MSQILGVGGGKFLTFDRSWRDNGGDATYALVGGTKVLISGATRAKPEIFQRGSGFYYKDGTPVTELKDVDYLPTKFREMAEKFITEQAPNAEPLIPAATKEEAVSQAVKRGRGRPKKETSNKHITEVDNEEALRAVLGEDE